MQLLPIILSGCLAVTILDAIGSILSRKLNFKYTWFIIGSCIIYGTVAILASKINGILLGVLASGVVGAFDATIGLLISIKLKANISEEQEDNLQITPSIVAMLILIAAFVGLIAILIFG